MQDHIEIAAFDGFQLENEFLLENWLWDFCHFEILEWKELDIFVAGLLHVDEANVSEHVEALIPRFVPSFALLHQVSVFGRHDVVSGVQVLNYVVLNASGIRLSLVFRVETDGFLWLFLVL